MSSILQVPLSNHSYKPKKYMLKFLHIDNHASLPIFCISYFRITVNKHLTKAIWKELFTLVHRFSDTSFKLLCHVINLIAPVLLTGHISDGIGIQAKAKCLLISKVYKEELVKNNTNKYKMSQHKYIMDTYIIFILYCKCKYNFL